LGEKSGSSYRKEARLRQVLADKPIGIQQEINTLARVAPAEVEKAWGYVGLCLVKRELLKIDCIGDYGDTFRIEARGDQ
jgi:hypothetical protein